MASNYMMVRSSTHLLDWEWVSPNSNPRSVGEGISIVVSQSLTHMETIFLKMRKCIGDDDVQTLQLFTSFYRDRY